MQFCPDCGLPLEIKEIDQRQRLYCSRCNYVHYERLKAGAGAFIFEFRLETIEGDP